MRVFPLPPCSDHPPVLAVQDGRGEEMVRLALDDRVQSDALAYMLGELYPNASWNA